MQKMLQNQNQWLKSIIFLQGIHDVGNTPQTIMIQFLYGDVQTLVFVFLCANYFQDWN